jgi:hypothetical protein
VILVSASAAAMAGAVDAVVEMADAIHPPVLSAVVVEAGVRARSVTQMQQRKYPMLHSNLACASFFRAAKHRGVLSSFRR